jgi:CRP-like cAMP-binding protein
MPTGSSVGWRMPAAAFRREMHLKGAFFDVLSDYQDARLACAAQSAACNAVHHLEQRLARWLLMAYDRLGTCEFGLTQEFLAMILGSTRPTVTVIAGALQKTGLITHRRGHVTIVDRERLESTSCECYGVITDTLQGVINRALARAT